MEDDMEATVDNLQKLNVDIIIIIVFACCYTLVYLFRVTELFSLA